MKPEITLQEMAKCARRELATRRRVYTRHVLEGRMGADDANYEIDLMEAILANLESQMQGELFA